MPLPVIFPGGAERRAACRFLSNPRVAARDIPGPHQEAMADRCRSQPVVLAVQDTTTVNHSGLEATAGPVGPGGGGKGGRGTAAHAGVASVEGGCAPGVPHPAAGFREEDREKAVEGGGSGRWTDAFASAAGLAAACPRTRVVSLRDREGDMWELLPEGCGSVRLAADGHRGRAGRGERAPRRGLVRGKVAHRGMGRRPGTGTRGRDRRPSAAGDLRRCLASGAVTACTVMSGGRLAGGEPDRPARTVVHPDGVPVPAVHMAKPNHRRQRGPPGPARTVREFAASTARLAGSVP